MLIVESKNYSDYEKLCLGVLKEDTKGSKDKYIVGTGENYGILQLFKGTSGKWHTLILTKEKSLYGYRAIIKTYDNVNKACGKVREYVKSQR